MTDMFNYISSSQLFVLDQDQAKDFYVETLAWSAPPTSTWASCAG